MEKTTTKKTAKQEPKIIEKKSKDYTEILNKIFYCLIGIIVLLVISIFINIISLGEIKPTTTPNSDNNTEELGEYDVSEFNELTTSETLESIKKGDLQVVYIGRATCGYCVKFLPILKEAQEKLDYKTTYIDLEKMTGDDQSALLELDNEEEYIKENFGYTPMVLIFKDGKFVNGWVGYSEYDQFASFLEENGVK